MSKVKKPDQKSSRKLFFLSILAGLFALVTVTATINDIGITTDEPYYYKSCLQEIAWFRQAAEDFSKRQWSAPFSPEVLDRYWHFELIYNVHPPFYKLCSSLTLVLFEPWLGTMGAYRLSPAIMFSVLVALLFFTVGRRYGLLSGFWAAAGFALMPRIFGHAHFGATDMPITLLWFASAVSFHRALESRRWAPVFAIVYGLALSTKFTAFVIPLPLAAYVLLSRRFKQAAWPVGIALVVSPLLMIGLNPEWWHSTFERLHSYLFGSASRSEYLYIPTFYLGKKYDFYLPWHHSLIFTLFTVTPLVLAGFLYGFWRMVRRPLADQWASHMGLHWLVLHCVMMLPSSPGHDGVRLFLPSFAFLAVISAKGFSDFVSQLLPSALARLSRLGQRAKTLSAPLVLGVMIIPSSVVLARLHPYELCYYNCLAGGLSGARDLGMESTYWWDTINDTACKLINSTLPDSAVVYAQNKLHYMFLQRLGKIKSSLKFSKENCGYILQYYRQGMFNDQDWLLSRKGTPLAELKKDGVRLLAVFQYPRVAKEILTALRNSPRIESLYEMALTYDMLDMEDAAYIRLKEYLEYRPKDFKASMLMVNFCLERKLPDEALMYLNRVADNPEDPQMWYFKKGAAYFQLGKNELAIPSFRKSLEYRNLDFDSRTALAYIYYQMGKLEESARQYELVLYSQPYDERALYMLGLINQELERPEIAKSYYKRQLEENPQHLASLINMGLLERKDGETRQAAEYFIRALEVDSINILANSHLADLYAETNQTDLAERHYKIVLRENPEDSKAHLALAKLYLKDPNRQGHALEHLRILVRLIPERAEFIEKNFIQPLEAELAKRAGKP
ncbi:MAG TPA: tetratricopeptide repeat protein [archaeon]|nr:tetratricopeptide repeat protein [archaeon]